MITQTDLTAPDGRTLHVYDTAPGDAARLPVVWHHGTPNLGSPPAPLFEAADALGVRWIGYDRPGYGGSTAHVGRDVAATAADVALVADALEIDRFAVMGHSGGATFALACAALLPERVLAAVGGAGLAPPDAAGLDWYAGMADAGAGELRAATHGRAALEQVLTTTEFDPEIFTPADHAALRGPWSWLNTVVGPALDAGLDGMLDDDLAYVTAWGVDLGHLRAPVLIVHGAQDRVVPAAHGAWLDAHLPSAELWLRPDDGHLSVLGAAGDALRWLAEHARA